MEVHDELLHGPEAIMRLKNTAPEADSFGVLDAPLHAPLLLAATMVGYDEHNVPQRKRSDSQ